MGIGRIEDITVRNELFVVGWNTHTKEVWVRKDSGQRTGFGGSHYNISQALWDAICIFMQDGRGFGELTLQEYIDMVGIKE